MKKSFFILSIGTLVWMMVIPLGCGNKENDDHHSHEEEKDHDHTEEEMLSGAEFKPEMGVVFSDETRQILGLETAKVAQETLSQEIQVNIQIFGEAHQIASLDMDHTGCDVHGSGYLSPEKAVLVQPKQTVKLVTSGSETLDGFVVAVQKQLVQGETEVIIGVTTAGSNLKEGEFLNATVSIPRNKAVTVIPSAALLRTVAGTFVYVVNGKAYLRTAVKVGSHTGEKIEITDGLNPGDQVVTKPVETLWLIELRATKGGGHSH